jgi:NADPH:quinone reductase-like Zn-dependent oxidoreductase
MGFPGDLLGCEFSGYVVKLGPNLASNVRLGAHVAGMPRFYKGDVVSRKEAAMRRKRLRRKSARQGTHAQFVAVDSDLVFYVPESLYGAGAATLPVPLATSACVSVSNYRFCGGDPDD